MRRRELVGACLGSMGFAASPSVRATRSVASSRGSDGQDRIARIQVIEGDFFGTHFHRLGPVVKVGRSPTQWPPGDAIGSVRLWDSNTRWADLSPSRDRWDFAAMDAQVEIAERHQAPILYTLGSTPRWASSRPDEAGPYGPGCAAEPRVMGDWEDYVRRVLVRYKGRIAAYEVWNEPYFSDFPSDRRAPGFFSGGISQMVEMTRIARIALDATDPHALLASPGFVNGAHRIEGFLAAGGASLIDVLAYHFYCSDSTQFLREAADVHQILARHRLTRLPLWNTECGVADLVRSVEATAADLPQGDQGAAAKLAQFLLVGAASGLGRFYYYAWDNDLTGMVDRFGARNARAPVFEGVRKWLIGSRLESLHISDSGSLRVEAAHGEERRIFLWSDRPQNVRLPASTAWRVAALEALPGIAVGNRRISVDEGEVALTAAPVCVRLVRRPSS